MCINVTCQRVISAGLVHTFPSPLYPPLHACMTLPECTDCSMIFPQLKVSCLTVLPLLLLAAHPPFEAPVSDAATSLPPPQIHSTLDTAGQSGICFTADATLQLLFTSFDCRHH